MTFLKKAISVSTLGISAMVFPAMMFPAIPKDGTPASAAAYNPATMVNVAGTVAGVRQVPGSGVHLTVKAKTGTTFDVLVGPAAFLKLTRTNYGSGEYVEVQGSLVNGVVLSREVYGDDATLTLRDAAGTPVWTEWGL